MLHDLLDPETRMPRSNAFWLVLGAVVVAQLVAFWMVCSNQVSRAQARNAQFQLQQTALADCLQAIPGATPGSCSSSLAADTARPIDSPVMPAAVVRGDGHGRAVLRTAGGATPVGHTFR